MTFVLFASIVFVNTFVFEAQNILGCTAVFLIECRPTFQSCVLPPSSGQYIPEDSELHTRRRENLKSHTFVFVFICGLFSDAVSVTQII
jgi:hypothetical protein